MSATSNRLPTDAADLPEASAPELVELSDGDRFHLHIAPVAKRLEKADARTRRLAKRILLGDRPVQAAARIGRQIVGARIRRALST